MLQEAVFVLFLWSMILSQYFTSEDQYSLKQDFSTHYLAVKSLEIKANPRTTISEQPHNCSNENQGLWTWRIFQGPSWWGLFYHVKVSHEANIP